MTTASPRPASLGPLLGWRVPTVDEGRSEIFPSLVVGALLDLAREEKALPASLEKVAAISTRRTYQRGPSCAGARACGPARRSPAWAASARRWRAWSAEVADRAGRCRPAGEDRVWTRRVPCSWGDDLVPKLSA